MLISTDKNIRCQNSEDHCVLNCANYVLVAGFFEYGNSISANIKFMYITARKGFCYSPAACMGPNIRTVFWCFEFVRSRRASEIPGSIWVYVSVFSISCARLIIRR
jgi:hypothetical protein